MESGIITMIHTDEFDPHDAYSKGGSFLGRRRMRNRGLSHLQSRKIWRLELVRVAPSNASGSGVLAQIRAGEAFYATHKIIPVLRRRRKRRRGHHLQDPRTSWRLGLMRLRDGARLFKGGLPRAPMRLPATWILWRWRRGVDYGDDISAHVWRSKVGWRLSVTPRLYLSSLLPKKNLDFLLVSGYCSADLSFCSLVDCISRLWFDPFEKVSMENQEVLMEKNKISFKKFLVSDHQFSKEQSENVFTYDQNRTQPTMVEETVTGSALKRPFGASPSGSKKDKGKESLIMTMNIYTVGNKDYELHLCPQYGKWLFVIMNTNLKSVNNLKGGATNELLIRMFIDYDKQISNNPWWFWNISGFLCFCSMSNHNYAYAFLVEYYTMNLNGGNSMIETMNYCWNLSSCWICVRNDKIDDQTIENLISNHSFTTENAHDHDYKLRIYAKAFISDSDELKISKEACSIGKYVRCTPLICYFAHSVCDVAKKLSGLLMTHVAHVNDDMYAAVLYYMIICIICLHLKFERRTLAMLMNYKTLEMLWRQLELFKLNVYYSLCRFTTKFTSLQVICSIENYDPEMNDHGINNLNYCSSINSSKAWNLFIYNDIISILLVHFSICFDMMENNRHLDHATCEIAGHDLLWCHICRLLNRINKGLLSSSNRKAMTMLSWRRLLKKQTKPQWIKRE